MFGITPIIKEATIVKNNKKSQPKKWRKKKEKSKSSPAKNPKRKRRRRIKVKIPRKMMSWENSEKLSIHSKSLDFSPKIKINRMKSTNRSGSTSWPSVRESSTTRESSEGTSEDGRRNVNRAMQRWHESSKKCKNTLRRWWKNQCYLQGWVSSSRSDRNFRCSEPTMPSSSKPPKSTIQCNANMRSSGIQTISMRSFSSHSLILSMLTVSTQWESSWDCRATTLMQIVLFNASSTSIKWQQATS